MPAIRGKFKVTKITRHACNPTAAEIELQAVYTGSAEDNSFAASTPSAKIEMNVSNPDAIEYLPLGKSFYVNFTPIAE